MWYLRSNNKIRQQYTYKQTTIHVKLHVYMTCKRKNYTTFVNNFFSTSTLTNTRPYRYIKKNKKWFHLTSKPSMLTMYSTLLSIPFAWSLTRYCIHIETCICRYDIDGVSVGTFCKAFGKWKQTHYPIVDFFHY